MSVNVAGKCHQHVLCRGLVCHGRVTSSAEVGHSLHLLHPQSCFSSISLPLSLSRCLSRCLFFSLSSLPLFLLFSLSVPLNSPSFSLSLLFSPSLFFLSLSLSLSLREKKKEKDREELWRQLEELELRRAIQNSDASAPAIPT